MINPLSHQQVVIIGAGPVGMLLALQLKAQGKQVLLIEARAAETPLTDQRTLALSYHSLQTLCAAGVQITASMLSKIMQVHVSRQGQLGRVLLRAEDLSLPYLGASIDYACLMRACEQALQAAEVPVLWQSPVTHIATLDHLASVHYQHAGQACSLTTQWLVVAEGGKLVAGLPGIQVRCHDYQQKALVNTIAFEKTNQGIAYERFTHQGPLALLPYGDDFRLVWTCSLAEAEQRLSLTPPELSETLRTIMGDRLGAVRQLGQAATFPLQLRQLNRVYSKRVICIGNAAQTMHPVAAQGLNLGMRDAMALAAVLGNADARQLDDSNLARAYARQRYQDARAVVGFTHALVQWFDGAGTLMQRGQGMGMGLLGAIAPLRQRFTRHLVFGL